MIRSLRVCSLAVAVLLSVVGAQATIIDFEGLAEGPQSVFVASDGNILTITADGGLTPNVAGVGTPTTAFVPMDTPDGGVGGTRFLSDGGLLNGFDYFIEFDQPVNSLALSVYDFRADSFAVAGDSVTLTVFSDLFTTSAGSASFTIPLGFLPDGNVVGLAVPFPAALIRSAAITFTAPDVGTAIDDITFTTVPEPWTAFLLGAGLLGICVLRRRQVQGDGVA
jgi:hypothetical protein